MPGRGRRTRFLRCAERLGAFVTKPHCCSTLLVHVVTAQERPPVRHGALVDRLMEVLGFLGHPGALCYKRPLKRYSFTQGWVGSPKPVPLRCRCPIFLLCRRGLNGF